MATTQTLTEQIVTIPNALWDGAMRFYSGKLGEPDRVVPEGSIYDAQEVVWSDLHFVRGDRQLLVQSGYEIFVGCKDAGAVEPALRELKQWTKGKVKDPVRQLMVTADVPGVGLKSQVVTLASVEVPKYFLSEQSEPSGLQKKESGGQSSRTDADDSGASSPSNETADGYSEDSSDEMSEEDLVERVVLGVIHNPNI